MERECGRILVNGLFPSLVSHSGHQSLSALSGDVVGKFFGRRRSRAFSLLGIRFFQCCYGFCICTTAYPNRCSQLGRCLSRDGIGNICRLGAALFALAWLRPFRNTAKNKVVAAVREYPAGDEARRLELLNARDDVKFSDRCCESICRVVWAWKECREKVL